MRAPNYLQMFSLTATLPVRILIFSRTNRQNGEPNCANSVNKGAIIINKITFFLFVPMSFAGIIFFMNNKKRRL